MTKIEEVARAICKAEGYDFDELADGFRGVIDQQRYLHLARSAIAAMRDPTVDMCENGAQALEPYNPSLRTMRKAFRAMIDRVLSEGK